MEAYASAPFVTDSKYTLTHLLTQYLSVESCRRITMPQVPEDPTQILQEQDVFTLMQVKVGSQHHNRRMEFHVKYKYKSTLCK